MVPGQEMGKNMDKIEQLENKLNQTPAVSTERIDILNDLVWDLAVPDFERSKELAAEALHLSEKLNYPKGLVNNIRNKGIELFFTSEPEQAEKHFSDAHKRFRELGDKRGEGDVLYFLGLIYWSFGEIEKGFECTTRSLKMAREVKYAVGEAWALNMLGGYYYDLKDYRQSLEHFRKAYDIFEREKHKEGESRSLNGMGNNYYRMGEHENALKYQERSLKILKNHRITQVESRVLNDLAGMMTVQGKYDQALEHLNRSLQLRHELGYAAGETTTLLDMGKLLLLLNRTDEAERITLRALQLAESIHAKPKISKACRILSEISSRNAKFQDSLEWFKKYHELEKEIYQEDSDKKLKYIEDRYHLEASKKEAEIYRLKNVELKSKNEELERLLNELSATQRQLIHSEKMAALGNLVAGLVHEINNPNGVVNSANDVILRCIGKIEGAVKAGRSIEELLHDQTFLKSINVLKENNKVISSASGRIGELVKNLKNFARLDEAEFQNVDLHDGLESTLALLKDEIGNNLTLVKNFEELPRVYCFPSQLNQVFMILLKNAIQSTAAGGTITINTFARKNEVYIQISDTGKGIPAEQLDDLFDFNFSESGPRVKLSTGLVTANNIVQRHKGKIEVRSEPGKGSEITVAIPAGLENLL